MIYTPTPSTKHLVELIKVEPIVPTRILDLCCGSGWIAEEMARYFPLAEIWASDIRDEEFTKNPRINWNKGDLFEGLSGKYDLIICNFPYLPTELCGLSEEPRIAFDGGHDGFRLTERFIRDLPKFLDQRYLVAIEMFHTHGELLPSEWEVKTDVHGVCRFAFLRDNYGK